MMVAGKVPTKPFKKTLAQLESENALARRGNAQVREMMKDVNRAYDPDMEKAWEMKYKFFSAKHMQRSFRTYTRARHDPFNKEPSWGNAVLFRVADECARKGISLQDLFRGVDVTGDGNLNRPEIKRVICSVLPSLSDGELVSIFDSIDSDHSGEVSIEEFIDKLKTSGPQGMAPGSVAAANAKVSSRWRNPVHKMRRYPPAQVEGWDHLEAPPDFDNEEKLVEHHQDGMMFRLAEVIATSRVPQLSRYMPKYKYFSGGADSIERQLWKNPKAEGPTPIVPDPGQGPRPGWFADKDMKPLTMSVAGTSLIAAPSMRRQTFSKR